MEVDRSLARCKAGYGSDFAFWEPGYLYRGAEIALQSVPTVRIRTLIRTWAVGLFLLTGMAQQDAPPDPKFAALANQLLTADEAGRRALLSAHQELGTPELVKALQYFSNQAFDRRDYTSALPMYKITCEVAASIGDRHGQGACTFNMGLSESRRFHPDEALAWYQQALKIYQEAGKPGDLVSPLNGIGLIMRDRGDMRQAIPYFERALTAAADAGNEVSIAQSSTNLGNLYHRLGNYVQAIQCLQKALEITRRLGLERQTALVMNNIGSTYFDQHDLELALSYNEQSLAIREKRSDPVELASSVLNTGVVLQTMGNSAKAQTYFDRALQLTALPELTTIRVLAMYNYGNLLFHGNQIGPAREKLEAAIQLAESIGDTADANNARILLGQIAEGEGRFAVAEQLGQTASTFARLSGERLTLIRALDLVGESLREQEKPVEAESAFKEAIALIEELRRELPGERQGVIRFMEDQTHAYLHMVQLQLDRRRPEAALAYVERSKARSLLEVLRTGNSGITQAMTAEEREQEGLLAENVARLNDAILRESRRPSADRKRITELGSQLEKARTDSRVFEVLLYTAHPELKVKRLAFEPAPSGELLAAIPDPKAALLEYSVTDDGVYLFALTRAGDQAGRADLRVYKIGARKEALERDVKRYREQVATRDLDYQKLAVSLYRELLEPAAEQLRGKSTVVIAPDGFLWQLPFQALETEPERYLMEDRAIFYTPSLSVLYEMEKMRPAHRASQPRLMAVDAVQLPAARREVEGLRELYGAGRSHVFSAAESDQVLIRREAPNYDVVHVAAHGVFEDRNPMNSYLVLAKAGKPEAGVLEARDMMDLNLRAEMVVLSGCETGRGKAGNGEGLIRMSWALFIAGSPSTVASQWKVESDSTTRLMLGFHRNLQRSSKARALQQAQLEVMKRPEYRHPFYWSGFVLMGEGF
uniref:Tetratricopeptide TPR_2 repeat protein n=1 Tax=Solibacter usitatus (strain Ellin6076) TaxID=234267 RepID=Q028B5_SOLUE